MRAGRGSNVFNHTAIASYEKLFGRAGASCQGIFAVFNSDIDIVRQITHSLRHQAEGEWGGMITCMDNW